jgi:putative oxidoreductase
VFSSRYHVVLALLRIVSGFIVWQHGAQTLFGMFGGSAAPPLTLRWLAGGVEFFGGIAIAVGFLTRPFGLAIAPDMAVLYVTQFLPLGFPPIVNRQGEVACLLFNTNLLLAFTGPGRWSVDGAGDSPTARVGVRALLSDLGRHTPAVLGAVRIFMGLLFLSYGLRKMFGLLGGEAEMFLSLQWFAGIVELFGGLALIAGLVTRWTAFLCSGQMAFAYIINHNPRGFFPIENGGERAALFCYFFLFVWVGGAGRWSVDGYGGSPSRDQVGI